MPHTDMTTLAGRFALERQLGAGAFGKTYLARDLELSREVALKLFDPRHATSDWKARELFEREASVLRALRHQGVPEVFDFLHVEHDGRQHALLVMEFVDGVSVQRMIDEQHTLAPEDALHLFLELLNVLEYLHARVPPILHRDIKPTNIIVRPSGTPVLVDFGSVRNVFMHEDEGGSTIVGTYGYMPYEQYMGQATPSSDLYALAATFLHLMTGRAPRDFVGHSGAIEVPAKMPGDARMVAALQRMLRRAPGERFASAREVRQAILSPTTHALVVSDQSTAIAHVPRQRTSLVRGSPLNLSADRPRKMDAELRKHLRALTPTTFALTDTSIRRQRPGVLEVGALVFVGVMTMGILPLVFYGYHRARKQLMSRFLRNGVEGEATVIGMTKESTAFGEKMMLVSYEFDADGQVHRDADRVLPYIAQRWAPGDTIRILYIPEQQYESVIVSTR